MKIVELNVENFKRIRAVTVRPDGDAVIISGRNAQGKSSVLDAIWAALGGREGNRIDKPIREGEDTATVRVDLGDLIVTRQWTAKGTTVKVEARDGAVYKKPQDVINGFFGKLSFDPLAFAEADPKAQLDELLKLVELPFDPDEIDRRRKGVFEERTAVGVEAKRLSAQVEGLPKPPEGIPYEPVSAGRLIQDIQEAQAAAAENARKDLALSQARERVKVAEDALRVSLQRLAECESSSYIPVPDIEGLRDELDQVEQTNQVIRDAAEWRRLSAAAAAKKAEQAELTTKLDAIDAEKRDGLAAAKFPVDGLGFEDGAVTFTGIPFSQASGAERLRVSLAIAVAMNPELRVARVADASLLDAEGMATLVQLAADHMFQIWIERVEDGAATVIIEDGQVVA